MVARYVVSPRGGRRAHPDIASALRAAAARNREAVVEIAPGYYREALAVRGRVRLVAAEGPGSVVVERPSGAVLDAFGTVGVHGLTLIGGEADVVGCHAGTLVLEHTGIQARNGVALHAWPHTSVTVRDGSVLHGRVLFDGARGFVERCRFTDAADNAIAVIAGAHASVRDSRIEGSRLHGLRVCGARAEVTGCTLTGTGRAALTADGRAELAVADCVVTDVHAEGILFAEQSRGSVDRTRVTDARQGVAVTSGADPVVRRSVFAACRDTGITVRTAGRGRFEDCEVLDAGNVSVFSSEGGAPEVHGVHVMGGNVGIAVIDGARGRFGRFRIEGLTGVALRVFDGSGAVFEHGRVERCQVGLETRGDGGTTASLAHTVFRDVDLVAVAVDDQSRVTAEDVTVEGGSMGISVAEGGQLRARDMRVTGTVKGGALVFGRGRLVARGLTVTGTEGTGIVGRDSAFVDVAHGEFTDCANAGAVFADDSSGRLADCAVNGTRGRAVVHNGLVDLVSLRTSLPVVRKETPPAGPAPTVVNRFDGPVFHAEVHGAQFAWNNDSVVQNQQPEGEDTPS